MEKGMPGIANYAQHYHEKHPEEAVKIGFLPASIWSVFEYAREYDLFEAKMEETMKFASRKTE